MPRWVPTRDWTGFDAFVIGGGRSLEKFDWTLLRDEKVVGCNQAFRLGEDVVDVCVFGDHKFIVQQNGDFRESNTEPMSKFGGLILTNEPKCRNVKLPWLYWADRKSEGLSKTSEALAWNSNTGATAFNVALLLGAARVYLLGFDMKLTGGRPNWHDQPLLDKPKDTTYDRMIERFRKEIKGDLAKYFPKREVYNVNADTRLDAFPVLDPTKFWTERKGHGPDRLD